MIVTFTEAGGHPVNEDAFLVRPHQEGWLCLLADGQGGRAGGARAAQLACQVAAETAMRLEPRGLASAWPDVLHEADEVVLSDPDAGYTTLIGLCIAGGIVSGASSGDSMVLVASAGERAREVTAGQLKNSPVGSGAARFVPFGTRLDPSWTVLAMSDGVWKYVGWDCLIETMAAWRGQGLVDVLQHAARLPKSGQFPDDFTLVLFEEIG